MRLHRAFTVALWVVSTGLCPMAAGAQNAETEPTPSVAEALPLRATEEMERVALDVAGRREPRDQLRRLQQFLFDSERFPFDYDAQGTYTAAEAFRLREGNCVSFTNLFIALGRTLGIPLKAALIRRGDSELDGDLVVVNNHMVAVYQHSEGVTVYDFSQSRGDRIAGLLILDDAWVRSIYLNNKGVEALRTDAPEKAIELFQRALRLAPEFTAIHGNLGVAYRRTGQPERALEIYRQALELEARDPSVLNNLAKLLRAMGRDDEAHAALQAANLRNATPFLLITRGDLEVQAGNPREALKLYKKARRADPDLPDPWVAMARAHLTLGDRPAAHRSVRRALKLDDSHEEALELAHRLGVVSPND